MRSSVFGLRSAVALLVSLGVTSVAAQTAVPIPSVTGPITGPGPMYTAVMDLPNQADYQRLVSLAGALGYDTSLIRKVPQRWN